MRKYTRSPARTIREGRVRVSRGPWSVYINASAQPSGRLIVGLGRVAGGAVVRSRVRRLARDVVKTLQSRTAPFDLLLLARGNVQTESRRTIRQTLRALIERGIDAIGG